MAEHRTLHIVFNCSAAGTLRQALQTVGKDEDVIALGDDWSFGPPAEVSARYAFTEDELGFTAEEIEDEFKAFFTTSLNPNLRRVVWLSRWSTQEYCGFLEWVRRNGDQPFEIIDLTDVSVPTTSGDMKFIACTGWILEHQFRSEALWNLAKPASDDERHEWQRLWAQLCRENAPLRVLSPDGLTSAPIDYFDGHLQKHLSAKWQRAGRIMGRALEDIWFRGFRDAGVFEVRDFTLRYRLQTMVDAGIVETKGVTNISAHTWVRLPRYLSQ